MSTSKNVISSNPDSEVHITSDQQKKINMFAVRNGWMEELEQELKTKENDLKNLEDAEQEIYLVADDSTIPILVGDSYVHYDADAATEELGKRVTAKKEEIKKLEGDITSVKAEMNKLKADLYEKFGDNINLEHEES